MASILKKLQSGRPSEASPGDEPNDRQSPRVINQKAASSRIIKRDAEAVPDASSSKEARIQPHSGIAKNGVAGLVSGATLGKHPSGSSGLVEFNLSDITEQGRDQLRRCQQQVDAMLSEARKQAETIKATAKAQGHTEGKAQAAGEIDKRIQFEADAKAKAQVASLQQAVLLMRDQYDQWMKSYAEILTSTAISAAERLTRSMIRLPGVDSDASRSGNLPKDADENGDEHLLIRWAREALHSTRSASRLTLAVHPDTLAELGKSLDVLLANPDLPEKSIVVPDETLSVGDIIVRQDGGEISAGLDAQLHRLREELM